MSGAQPIRTAAEATPIAEANTGLLYKAMLHYRALWPNGDEDEALGIANLAYWRCCLAFDPALGTLGTLVFRAVRNGLLRAARDAEAAKRRPHASAIPIVDWDRPTMPPADPIDRAESAWWLGLLLEEDLVICRLRAEGRNPGGAPRRGRQEPHARAAHPGRGPRRPARRRRAPRRRARSSATPPTHQASGAVPLFLFPSSLRPQASLLSPGGALMTNPANPTNATDLAPLWSAALEVLGAARTEATMGDLNDGKPFTLRADSRRRLAASVARLDELLDGEQFAEIFRLAPPGLAPPPIAPETSS